MEQLADFRAFRLTQALEHRCRLGHRTSKDLMNCLVSPVRRESCATVGNELLGFKHADLPRGKSRLDRMVRIRRFPASLQRLASCVQCIYYVPIHARDASTWIFDSCALSSSLPKPEALLPLINICA